MKKLIALALSTAMVVAIPTAANARDWHRDGDRDGRSWDDGGRHHHRYRSSYYRDYSYAYPRVGVSIGYAGYPGYGYYDYGYGYPAYGYGYPAYGYGVAYPAYGYGYGYPPYYSGYGYRCGNPVAGAAIGGVAGAVIGNAITNDGHRRYRYYGRGGNGAAGAIVGGAIGAIAGGAIASGNC